MNKILFSIFFLINSLFSFIDQKIPQEYSIICENNNSSCKKTHNIYKKTGELLFELWLSLDLLLSISVDFSHYENIYEDLKNKINSIKKNFIDIQNYKDREHLKDYKKLLSCIESIEQHQIIKYTEDLKLLMQSCKIIL